MLAHIYIQALNIQRYFHLFIVVVLAVIIFLVMCLLLSVTIPVINFLHIYLLFIDVSFVPSEGEINVGICFEDFLEKCSFDGHLRKKVRPLIRSAKQSTKCSCFI